MADDVPIDDVSTADAAQLARWAYGRADSGVDPLLAEAAQVEIARRAEVARVKTKAARAEAARVAAAAAEDDDDDADNALDSTAAIAAAERHHRRRMHATGLTGVVAVALALGAGVVVLAQPEPDPLAIFGGADTEADLEWAEKITSNVPGTITAGPRAIELGDGYVAVVTRMSTVPEGQSTAWDSYCLSVSQGGTEKGRWAIMTTCAYPEKFEREGIVFPQGPSATGEGFDTVTWIASAGPRLDRNLPLGDGASAITSVLDWMAYPSPPDPARSSGIIVDDLERLLVGPASIPIYAGRVDPNAFSESDLSTSAYLVTGLSATSEPRLCVQVTEPGSSATSTCMQLSDARRDGVEVAVNSNGRTWIIVIDPDGPSRSDSVRLAD